MIMIPRSAFEDPASSQSGNSARHLEEPPAVARAAGIGMIRDGIRPPPLPQYSGVVEVNLEIQRRGLLELAHQRLDELHMPEERLFASATQPTSFVDSRNATTAGDMLRFSMSQSIPSAYAGSHLSLPVRPPVDPIHAALLAERRISSLEPHERRMQHMARQRILSAAAALPRYEADPMQPHLPNPMFTSLHASQHPNPLFPDTFNAISTRNMGLLRRIQLEQAARASLPIPELPLAHRYDGIPEETKLDPASAHGFDSLPVRDAATTIAEPVARMPVARMPSSATSSEAEADEPAGIPGRFRNRNYITSLRRVDVLCGRGGRSNNHFGNKRFRQIVTDLKERYRSIDDNTRKTDLSQQVVEHIYSYGGRFVRIEKDSDRYYVLSDAEARRKTSQALREVKQLKWISHD